MYSYFSYDIKALKKIQHNKAKIVMSEQQEIIYQENQNQQSASSIPETDSDGERKVYFIILRPSEQQINFKNLEFLSEITPENFFNKTIKKEDKNFLEEIVFKFKKTTKEKEKRKKSLCLITFRYNT